MTEWRGGCRCGAVRYVVTAERLPRAYACHCRDCQTWTGSAFSEQCVLTEDRLEVSGPVALYEFTAPSGRVSRQRVCGTCHTRLFNTNDARPGMVILRAGTLDDSDSLDVVAHIWVSRKQPWIGIAAGVPCWPEAPPTEALLAALGPA